MTLFLLTFFVIYGAMNAYLFWWVRRAAGQMGRAGWLLGGFLVVMIAAPVLVRMFDRWKWFRLADVAATVAFSWLAVVFWVFVLGMACDLWNQVVRIAAFAAPSARAAQVPARPAALCFAVLIAVAFGWGLIEAGSIRVRRLTVPVARLPDGMKRLTIVQISDLHLGVHTGRRRLRQVVRRIAEVGPDVLVSTGDLVDSSFHNVNSMSDLLASVDAPRGKFAVVGNHEVYAGLSDSAAFHEAVGLRLLRGESVRVCEGVRIAGVDDPAAARGRDAMRAQEERALAGAGDDEFVVLLKHQPTVSRSSRGRVGLQLSGHTHGGQIFPWGVMTALSYRYVRGLHELDGGGLLYVTTGAGTWGPPIRVLAPPEIVAVTLEAAPQGAGRPDAE